MDVALQQSLQRCERALGRNGRLGVSAVLLDPAGSRRGEIRFKSNELFPMASAVKVAIGMVVASRIATGAMSLSDKIIIDSRSAAPGLIGNPLDRLYFFPFETSRTETLDRIVGFMLRRSDNTATDAVLRSLGGTSVVSRFLLESGIPGFWIKRTMAQLLEDYYDLQPAGAVGRARQIIAAIRRLTPAYGCRFDREYHLIHCGEETCTPAAMTQLLTMLAVDRKYDPVYSHMQGCATGQRRIAAGLKNIMV